MKKKKQKKNKRFHIIISFTRAIIEITSRVKYVIRILLTFIKVFYIVLFIIIISS